MNFGEANEEMRQGNSVALNDSVFKYDSDVKCYRIKAGTVYSPTTYQYEACWSKTDFSPEQLMSVDWRKVDNAISSQD